MTADEAIENAISQLVDAMEDVEPDQVQKIERAIELLRTLLESPRTSEKDMTKSHPNFPAAQLETDIHRPGEAVFSWYDENGIRWCQRGTWNDEKFMPTGPVERVI